MRPRTLAALGILALLTTAASGFAGTYAIGGTVVARGFFDIDVFGVSSTGVDNGVMLCAADGSSGIGGLCLPASATDNAVFVTNELGGSQVAYQVCIDHNQDNLCTAGNGTAPGACFDELFFSHDDLGLWHNPLGGPGVLSTILLCPGEPWDGSPAHWLIFICNGLHQNPPTGAHAHPTNGGTGVTANLAVPDAGNVEVGFCQPNDSISAKAYRMY